MSPASSDLKLIRTLCTNDGLFLVSAVYDEGIKFLTINLEGDIINFAFACVVQVNLIRKEIENELCTQFRPDNQFRKVEYISIDDIPKELISVFRNYHPSLGILMLYTYLNAKGAAQLRKQLLEKQNKLKR